MSRTSARRNLYLVMIESIITHGSISVAIMTPFFHSIGLNQAQIAASQAIFTLVLCALNFPTGWLADRFSRKWANVIGDVGCLIGYAFYAHVNSFGAVVISECWLGFFMSFSQGVDLSLLQHFSKLLSADDVIFRQHSANLAFWQYAAQIILCLVGGPLGVVSFRLAILANSAIYGLAAVISLFVRDDSEKLDTQSSNPLVDKMRIARYSFSNQKLRRRILAYAVTREMTHGIIWVFTPMLMSAGIPLIVVSSAWAINAIMCSLGARLAARTAIKLSDWQIIIVPLLLVSFGLGVIGIHLNFITVWLYLLVGLAQGWTAAAVMPLIQNCAPASEQTAIISLAKVVGQILYVAAVYLIGVAADIELRYAALMTLMIFLPLGIITVYDIHRE